MPGAAVGGRCRLGLADRCAKKFSLQPPTVEGGEVPAPSRFQGSVAGTESAAPLAVPGAAIGRRCRLGLADRCAKKFPLQPPTLEGREVACSKSLSGQHGRNGKRGPSCGARRGHRQALPPRPCRPLRQKILPVSAAGGGRIFCPCFRRSGSNPGRQNEKPRTFVRGFFWRRRRDLNPRAGFPTYALSRGASSTS